MCYQSVPLPQYSGNSILNTKLTDTRITDYYLSNARFKNEVIILLKKCFLWRSTMQMSAIVEV